MSMVPSLSYSAVAVIDVILLTCTYTDATVICFRLHTRSTG